MSSSWSDNHQLNGIFQALQPCRDPQANFQIDVSGMLNKFSKEINDVKYLLPGLSEQQVRLNFYQAALLIQNSTLILSKKIEYLHVLAYEALNKVEGKKEKVKKGAAGAFSIDDCINPDPKDLFQGGYIEDYITQNRNLSLPNKTLSIPKLPANLLSRESEQYIHLKFPDFKDTSGKDIGKWDDFMINNSLYTLDGPLSTAKFLTERLYSDFETECLRRAESENYNASQNFTENITNAAEEFGERPLAYESQVEVDEFFANTKNLETHDKSFAYIPSPNSEEPLQDEIDILPENTIFPEENYVKKTSILFTPLDPNSHIPALDGPFKKHQLKPKLSKNIYSEKLPLNQLLTILKTNANIPKNNFKRPRFPEMYPLMISENNRRMEKAAKILDVSINRSYDDITVGAVLPDDPVPLDHNSSAEEFLSNVEKKPYIHPDIQYSPAYEEENFPVDSLDDNPGGLLSNNNSFGIDITKYLLEVRRTGRKVETDLTRNVKNWEKHIASKFAAQKKEPAFNISIYTSSIANWFEDDRPIKFSEKVKANDSFDISRLFVTMLHMVNSGNLELEPGNSTNSFSIRLVSRDIPSFENQ